MTRIHRSNEEGSALVMALVFVFVIGLVIMALLAQTSTAFRVSRVVEETTQKDYAVDAALEQAIETLRLFPTICPETGSSETMPPINVNEHDVEVTCQTVDGSSSGASGWAVVITGTSEDSFDVSGGAGTKTIEGPMYAANLGTYNKPWEVENGDLYEGQSASGCTLADATPPNNATVTPSPPYAYRCTTDGVPSIDHDLPSAAPAAAPFPPENAVGCTVFSPGTYSGAAWIAALNAPGDKYFKSGTYYFEDIGEWVVDGTLIGGKKAATTSREVNEGDCAGQEASDTNAGTGVKLLFGGSSRMTVLANGGSAVSSVELFARADGAASEGRMNFSVQAVETTAGGFTASSLSSSTPLLSLSGNTADFVAHGVVYVPSSFVSAQINKTQSNFQGGVVVQSLVLGSSNNISGLVVSGKKGDKARKMVVTARAQGKDGARDSIGTVVLTIDNNSAATFEVESWRIE